RSTSVRVDCKGTKPRHPLACETATTASTVHIQEINLMLFIPRSPRSTSTHQCAIPIVTGCAHGVPVGHASVIQPLNPSHFRHRVRKGKVIVYILSGEMQNFMKNGFSIHATLVANIFSRPSSAE